MGLNDMSGRIRTMEVVIGTEDGATYTAAAGQTQKYSLDFGKKRIPHAWYMPVGNMGDLVAFDEIRVEENTQETGDVYLTIKPNRSALLRIVIFAVLID